MKNEIYHRSRPRNSNSLNSNALQKKPPYGEGEVPLGKIHEGAEPPENYLQKVTLPGKNEKYGMGGSYSEHTIHLIKNRYRWRNNESVRF